MRWMTMALAVVWAAGAVQAENRLKISGRDVTLDGKATIPHGMVHASPEEFDRLQKLGTNSISIDLAFSSYDPKASEADNRRALEPYLKTADAAHKRGQTVLWLFAFHYTPDWLWQRYPDVRMKKFDGSDGAGGWTEMCLNHPGFRRDAESWLRFAVGELKKHPATIGYITWNEPHLFGEVDYHPLTIAAFRQWLNAKYKTIDAVNASWGTAFATFDAVTAPPPRGTTAWLQYYDQLATQKGTTTQKTSQAGSSPQWMDWMRFRQENYAAFFVWESSVIHSVQPDAIVTSKIVPLELYGSHAWGVGTDTERWMRDGLDVLGMDLYPHEDDDFLSRWKSDFFLSFSAGKPVWDTEFNFSFVNERGLPTPQQWRAGMYYQLARGVRGYWNYHWIGGDAYALFYSDGTFAPVTHEIQTIARELQTLSPIVANTQPVPAQVAVLHSATTGLAVCGDYMPTADQTAMVDILYRSQTPFDFVSEDQIRQGVLKKYRLLIAVGAVAVPQDVLDGIAKFIDVNGGHVLANARFASFDERGVARDVYPPTWMGTQAKSLHREARMKTGTLTLTREARTNENKSIEARVSLDTWSSRSITLNDGTTTGAGNIFGNIDCQYDWSCNGKHELMWEDVVASKDANIAGRFADGSAAMVQTPQTLYIARDTCWVDERFEDVIRTYIRSCGVVNNNIAVHRADGRIASSVDVRAWQGDDKRILFVTNSAPTLHYKGEPINVDVTFDACGQITDALTGKPVSSQWRNFKRVVPMALKAGESRVLVGRPYPPGWQTVQKQYEEIRKNDRIDASRYRAFRRGADQLWLYDAQPELAVGTHNIDESSLSMMKKLGVRLVRYTIYWHAVESGQPGVYDESAMKGYDDAVALAKRHGIELVLIIHANPGGLGWGNRHVAYERFAKFAAFCVKRYPSVRFWELWNEMDTSFTDLFGAGRDGYVAFERGRCYAEMLKVAFPAVKQANPNAWVLVGGLSSGWPVEFIRGIYEGGGRDFFDIMNIHSYGVPIHWGMLAQAVATRNIMAEYGDANRPLWNTEFGISASGLWTAWKTSTGEAFDAVQCDQIKLCVDDAMKTRVANKIFIYQFHAGDENGPLKDHANEIRLPAGRTVDDYGFGMVRRDGKTPRPTYDWLMKSQVNRPLSQASTSSIDITVAYDGTYLPADGVAYQIANDKITFKNVRIDSLEPTIVRIVPKK